MASVIRPDEVLIARRAAISLPSGEEVISTAAGETFSTSCCSASALGATRKPLISASSTTYTFSAPYFATASAAFAPASAEPMNTADGSPSRLAMVSSS